MHSSRNEHLKVILEEFVANFYPDLVSVMLPPHSWLCRPCARNLEKLKSLRDELNRKEAELRGQVNAVGKLHGLDVQAQRVEGDEPSERAHLIPMSASLARARSPVKRSARQSGINLPGSNKRR